MSQFNRVSLEIYQAVNQRAYQEDRWVAQPVAEGYLLAVFDGHGRDTVAELASEKFAHYFKQGLRRELPVQIEDDRVRLSGFMHSISEQAIDAYINANQLLITDRQREEYTDHGLITDDGIARELGRECMVAQLNAYHWDELNSDDPDYGIHDALRQTVNQLISDCSHFRHAGSTLSMAYIVPSRQNLKVYTAQLGDSAVVILSPDKQLHVTNEHSVATCKADRAIIQNKIDEIQKNVKPGYWLRAVRLEDQYLMIGPGPEGQTGIAVTRALGDSCFNGLMIREAELQDFTVPIDSLVLGMTDGVHNNGDLEDRHSAYREIAERLQAAHSLQTIGNDLVNREDIIDNVTIVSVRMADMP